ncbi:MAG: hypothetical protein KJT03_20930, partial [Verrucomicrobiae bacterium]|nr:hypothetical protein [Verrucomicrobiae bacterium]
MFRLLEDPGYTPHGWSISDSFLKSLLFLCLLGFTPQAILLSAEEAAAAKEETTVPQTENAETIVSEKDSVSLVKDSSVAEAVKRRPDLNFANVTIDGENSGVSLSSLQADDVESVEVMKAVTPDQDADSRGGSISLKTRPTFAQTKRITALEGSWSYDSLDGAQGYRGRIFFSGPLNDAGTWGARASVSYRDSPYAMETLYQDWESRSLENTKHFVLRDTGYGHYQRDYDSIDFNASIDYKASDFLNFFLRNSLSNRDYLTTYNVLKFRFFRGNLVSVDENGADFENADIRNSIWRYNTRSDEAESTLGGNYEKEDLLIDFKITTKDDEVEYLDYFAI